MLGCSEALETHGKLVSSPENTDGSISTGCMRLFLQPCRNKIRHYLAESKTEKGKIRYVLNVVIIL